MERIDELHSKLRRLRQEYQGLRDDYEIIKQNFKANVDAKKAMRTEIDTLQKEYKELKGAKIEPEDEVSDRIDNGTDSLL
jgi:uncharacterized coiled-coil DUF342 family protein